MFYPGAIVAKVTLQDVADRADVSLSTASNCLNRRGRPSEETRTRVFQAARELGYAKFADGKDFRASSRSVALLVSVDPEWAFGWAFVLPIIQELESTLKDGGYRLALIPVRKGEDEKDVFDKITEIGPLAVVALHYGNSTLFVRLEWEQIPVVVVMNNEFQDAFYSVIVDDYHGAYDATERLLELGHRRIGFVGCEREGLHVLRTDRFLGYQKAHQVRRLRADQRIEVDVDPHDADAIRKDIKNLLELSDPPTALFCLDDDLALRVARELNALGIRVPDDVSLIAPGDVISDDVPTTGQRVSTMRINTNLMGREAGRMILERLTQVQNDSESEIEHHNHVVKINQMYVDRGSCVALR